MVGRGTAAAAAAVVAAWLLLLLCWCIVPAERYWPEFILRRFPIPTSVTDNRMANIAPCSSTRVPPSSACVHLHVLLCSNLPGYMPTLCSTKFVRVWRLLFSFFFHVVYRIRCTLFINSSCTIIIYILDNMYRIYSLLRNKKRHCTPINDTCYSIAV